MALVALLMVSIISFERLCGGKTQAESPEWMPAGWLVATSGLVGEDVRAQGFSIQRSVGVQNGLAERLRRFDEGVFGDDERRSDLQTFAGDAHGGEHQDPPAHAGDIDGQRRLRVRDLCPCFDHLDAGDKPAAVEAAEP